MEIGKEGEGRATGRESTVRGGAHKPIGGEIRLWGQKTSRWTKRKNKTGGEREQVEMKCENMRDAKKSKLEVWGETAPVAQKMKARAQLKQITGVKLG